MYSLDINFLKERPDYSSDAGIGSSKQLQTNNLLPLYLGLAIGLILPVVVGSGWLYLQNKNAQLEQEIAKLDAELGRLGIQEQELKKIQDETSQTKVQTQALATVFNQIRSWSAILQDIRERIPRGVQIENIKEIAATGSQPGQSAPNSAPQPGQPPSSAPQPAQSALNSGSGIEISGIARSFNDVNDFLLILQQSPFFKPIDTRIITAELIASPVAAAPVSRVAAAVPVNPPSVVRYTIQSGLSDTQASQLIRELERKGALGLVTRIRTLQQKGVIQR